MKLVLGSQYLYDLLSYFCILCAHIYLRMRYISFVSTYMMPVKDTDQLICPGTIEKSLVIVHLYGRMNTITRSVTGLNLSNSLKNVCT